MYRRVTSTLLRRWGMEVVEQSSPEKVGLPTEQDPPVDLVIVDAGFGGAEDIPAFSAIQRLRGPHALPVIVLASKGRRPDDSGARGARDVVHLAKPFKSIQLRETVSRVLGREVSAAPAQMESQSPTATSAGVIPMNVLFAEDNIVSQQVALRMLRKLGIGADVAGNGLEVLQALERRRYDVVFMDVQMPDMDGVEATRRIYERWPAEERPVIIAMTANAIQGDREKYLEAGMDDYVSKPVRMKDIQAVLNRVSGRLVNGASGPPRGR
jgi:CheY-like chemotaxis protein